MLLITQTLQVYTDKRKLVLSSSTKVNWVKVCNDYCWISLTCVSDAEDFHSMHEITT